MKDHNSQFQIWLLYRDIIKRPFLDLIIYILIPYFPPSQTINCPCLTRFTKNDAIQMKKVAKITDHATGNNKVCPQQTPIINPIASWGGGHSNEFMCCHPQASDYRSTPKHGYLEYEIMTPYHRYSFTDLRQ